MMKLPKLLFFCWLLLHIILYKRSYIDVNKTVYKSSYVNGHFIVPGAQDPDPDSVQMYTYPDRNSPAVKSTGII